MSTLILSAYPSEQLSKPRSVSPPIDETFAEYERRLPAALAPRRSGALVNCELAHR